LMTVEAMPLYSRGMPPASSHTVTLLPGEGIGPEVSQAVQRIIEAAGVNIKWDVIARPGGAEHPGEFPFAEAVASVKHNRTALKGPMATGVVEGPRSI